MANLETLTSRNYHWMCEAWMTMTSGEYGLNWDKASQHHYRLCIVQHLLALTEFLSVYIENKCNSLRDFLIVKYLIF